MRGKRRRVLRALLTIGLGLSSVAALWLAAAVEAPPRRGLPATTASPPDGGVASPAPLGSRRPEDEPGGTAGSIASASTAGTTAEPTAGPPVGPPAGQVGLYRAPSLAVPLIDLDPGLARRGPRPDLSDLLRYQYGDPALEIDPRAGPLSWQLARPDPTAVRGYADKVSVLAGQTIGFHLAGQDRQAQIDIFRMGPGDGRHVLSLPPVALFDRAEAIPAAGDGLVEEAWPRSALLRIPDAWASGVYLAKMTGDSGGQSYILFIVRAPGPRPLTVVLPLTTYAAYNLYGGADLYSWPHGPAPRAYRVSFNRPFQQEWGAGLFFRLDFPLIVWLEDHGYSPGYIADTDVTRSPGLALDARTLVFSGHGEYWSSAMRDTVEAAAAHGTNLAFFGANQAFWQVRFEADASGGALRTVVCYKSALLDPVAISSPGAATVRFQDPPVSRPSSSLVGLGYGGVIDGVQSLVVGAGIANFDPALDLRRGQLLPGLIGDEVDEVNPAFSGILLGATPVAVHGKTDAIAAGTSLWVNPVGYRVFDAGTFDFAWGLDPRYSAALPGFPAAVFSRLTAEILAWLGALPTI